MTREETLSWAKSLKPGDVVIQQFWDGSLRALTVKKVTTTGIVKTEDGESFAQASWSERINGRGRTAGEIIPATVELIAEAQKQKADREEQRRKAVAVRDALYKMRSISRISYEFAADFLELCEKHEL